MTAAASHHPCEGHGATSQQLVELGPSRLLLSSCLLWLWHRASAAWAGRWKAAQAAELWQIPGSGMQSCTAGQVDARNHFGVIKMSCIAEQPACSHPPVVFQTSSVPHSCPSAMAPCCTRGSWQCAQSWGVLLSRSLSRTQAPQMLLFTHQSCGARGALRCGFRALCTSIFHIQPTDSPQALGSSSWQRLPFKFSDSQHWLLSAQKTCQEAQPGGILCPLNPCLLTGRPCWDGPHSTFPLCLSIQLVAGRGGVLLGQLMIRLSGGGVRI